MGFLIGRMPLLHLLLRAVTLSSTNNLLDVGVELVAMCLVVPCVTVQAAANSWTVAVLVVELMVLVEAELARD